MTDNAPRCQECGRRLEAWMVSDRDGLFCSQRCGYVWAVRTVRVRRASAGAVVVNSRIVVEAQ